MRDRTGIITLRSLLIGALFVVFFAFVTVYFENQKNLVLTATQIAPAPFVLLFVLVLFINPVCRLIKVIRPFTFAEIMLIFVMGSVSAGISTFGMASQLVPVVGNLFNQHWNNVQSEWRTTVAPFMDEAFFVSEPGIREAASAYRKTQVDLERAQTALDRARIVVNTREKYESLKQAFDSLADDVEQTERISARQAMSSAKSAYQEALTRWEELRTENPELPSVEEVLKTFPPRIAQINDQSTQKRQKLSELEQAAFDRVETFRRGLPDDIRTFPGIVKMPDETYRTYVRRIQRVRGGLNAYDSLEEALAKIRGDAAPDDVLPELDQALNKLAPLTERSDLQTRQDTLDREREQVTEQIAAGEEKLRQLRSERRAAEASEFGRLERQIKKQRKDVEKLVEERDTIDRKLEHLLWEMAVTQRVEETHATLQDVRARLADANTLSGEQRNALAKDLQQSLNRFTSFDATLRAFFFGNVPWGVWLRPLMLWGGLILLTYAVLMSFNVLIFRQWAYNERLIYPLAELPEMLAGNAPGDVNAAERVPSMYRSGLFWTGAIIAMLVLGWNMICYLGILPNVQPLDLNNSWTEFIKGTPLQGLIPQAKSPIFFTLIGLSFLIPANISFSLWFFHVLYWVQLLILVGLGMGVNANSFTTEWWYTFNFRTAEGAGALVVFAALVLYKCRRYLFCGFKPSSVSDLEAGEQRELRISSYLFVFGSIGVILMLWRGLGANLLYTIFAYVVILMITIALVRAVTEGGILGFQAWCSPFHFIRSITGMDRAWTSPALFAPLMVYYSILFLDLKTFIAPAMANSLKIREDAKLSRGKFHLAVWISILLAMVTAVVVHLLLTYSAGADGMHGWFYTHFPRGLFDRISDIVKAPPVDDSGGRWWILFGALVMAGLLYFRQSIFWLPHPLGLIMLVNPLMSAYWFSILLGWTAKSLVTKYGNKDTYAHARTFFVGLIAGELLMVALALIISYVTGENLGAITLNRQ